MAKLVQTFGQFAIIIPVPYQFVLPPEAWFKAKRVEHVKIQRWTRHFHQLKIHNPQIHRFILFFPVNRFSITFGLTLILDLLDHDVLLVEVIVGQDIESISV